MDPFDVLKLIVKIGFFIFLIIFFIVRYRNKKKGIVDDAVDIDLDNTTQGMLILRHRKFWGKIQLLLDDKILEEFSLPKLSVNTNFTFNPKVVKGINEIIITRPVVLAGMSNGWRYQVIGHKKTVDITV